MPRAITKEIRDLVIHHRENGVSVNEIAEMLDISRRTVIRICKCPAERGTLSPFKSTGRPRVFLYGGSMYKFILKKHLLPTCFYVIIYTLLKLHITN